MGIPYPSRNGHASASPTGFREGIIIIDSESDDDFETIMSRRIAGSNEAIAQGSGGHMDVTVPHSITEAKGETMRIVANPKGSENKTGGGGPVVPAQKPSESGVAAKYEGGRSQKEAEPKKTTKPKPQASSIGGPAIPSPGEQGLEQPAECLGGGSRVASEVSVEIRSANRGADDKINTAKKRIADRNEGMRKAETGATNGKEAVQEDAQPNAKRQKVWGAISETVANSASSHAVARKENVESRKKAAAERARKNPAKGSPVVADAAGSDTRALDAIRSAYAARVAIAEDRASQRASSLNNSLGTEPANGTAARPQDNGKRAFRSLDDCRELKKVTFSDKLTIHLLFDEHRDSVDPQGVGIEAPRAPEIEDTRSEPRKTTGYRLGGQSPRAYEDVEHAQAELPPGGTGTSGFPEKRDEPKDVTNGRRKEQIKSLKMRDTSQTPKGITAEHRAIGQHCIAENTAIEQQSDKRIPLASSEKRDAGSGPKESTDEGSTEHPPNAQKSTETRHPPKVQKTFERTTDESVERESASDDSVATASSRSLGIAVLEEQRKRYTKNSSTKRRMHTVDEEMYWEYRVIRSTWRDDEDPPLQHHCGTYLDRESANKAARDQLFPPGASLDLTLYDEYHKEKDAFNMDIYSAQSAKGHILIFTERLLRHGTQADAVDGEVKRAWMKPKVFAVWEKYTEFEDDLFGENANENKVKSTTTTMLGIYTTRDLANKAASDHTLERIRRSAMDKCLSAVCGEVEFIEMQMQSRKHLEELEKARGLYNSESGVETRNEISVWVDEIDLIGPLN
jgi:hypothetical protein